MQFRFLFWALLSFFKFAMHQYTSLCFSSFWLLFSVLYSMYLSFCTFYFLRIQFTSLSNIQFSDLMISWSEKFQFLLLNSMFFTLCSIFNIFAWIYLCISWLFKINSSSFQSTTRFIYMRCWLQIFCKLCLSEELNNLININRAVTALYSHVELTHSWKARQ